MTRRTPIVAALGSVAVAVVVAGCGSGSSQDKSPSSAEHAALLRSVDAVCAKAVAAHDGHTFPVPDFDPESPDPNELPAVGDYFAQYGGLPTTTTALHALHPPTKDVAAWHAVLTDAGRLGIVTDSPCRQVYG